MTENSDTENISIPPELTFIPVFKDQTGKDLDISGLLNYVSTAWQEDYHNKDIAIRKADGNQTLIANFYDRWQDIALGIVALSQRKGIDIQSINEAQLKKLETEKTFQGTTVVCVGGIFGEIFARFGATVVVIDPLSHNASMPQIPEGYPIERIAAALIDHSNPIKSRGVDLIFVSGLFEHASGAEEFGLDALATGMKTLGQEKGAHCVLRLDSDNYRSRFAPEALQTSGTPATSLFIFEPSEHSNFYIPSGSQECLAMIKYIPA